MRESRRKIIALFLVNTILLLLAYGGFFKEGFSADALSQQLWPTTNIEAWMMNGRFLAALTGWLLHQIGINTAFHYKIFYLLFITMVAGSMTLMQEAALTAVERQESLTETWMIRGMIALIYINGLFTENFMFPECFLIFGLAYLFSALSGYLLFSGKRKIAAMLSFIVAAMFYQPVLIATVIIILAIAFIRTIQTQGRILFWIRNAICAALGTIALILLTLRLGSYAERLRGGVLSKSVGALNIGFILSELWRNFLLFCKSGMGLLPPVFLPGLCLLLPAVVCGTGVIATPAGNAEHRKTAYPWYLLFLASALSLSFSIVAGNGMRMLSGRLLGGLYATVAAGFLIAFCLTEKPVHRMVLGGLAMGFLLIQTVFCNTIMMNHYISNEKDLTYARMIYDQILLYEAGGGETVTKVAYTQDEVCYDAYEDVYYKFGEINARTIHRTGWMLLRKVTQEEGREFTLVDMDESVVQAYFAGRDWDTFRPQEQLVFQGDTLYWCVY